MSMVKLSVNNIGGEKKNKTFDFYTNIKNFVFSQTQSGC